MLSKSDFDITEAIRIFNNHFVEAAFLVPTKTGLEKSIADATFPIRAYLKEQGIHDYEGQLQGPDGKKFIQTFFVTETNLLPSIASLYRPKAKGKSGDPRIWFRKLSSYVKPNNLLGLVACEGSIYLVNFSNPSVIQTINTVGSPLNELIKKVNSISSGTCNELIAKLKEIANRGWIKTIKSGDTGVGCTLEYYLGIQANSRKTPDYKGIEIKAGRSSRFRDKTRTTLFAQVADWEISALKSSAEILDTYGYFRNSLQQLNCSLSAISPNSQGLMLRVDENSDLLHEIHQSTRGNQYVASWRFEVLRNRLLSKHKETFWIAAQSSIFDNVEHFQYKKVLHTKNPFASSFHTLCEQGVITVDHLIKRECGRVTEKGPLFKIKPSNLDLLFPPPKQFDLLQ